MGFKLVKAEEGYMQTPKAPEHKSKTAVQGAYTSGRAAPGKQTRVSKIRHRPSAPAPAGTQPDPSASSPVATSAVNDADISAALGVAADHIAEMDAPDEQELQGLDRSLPPEILAAEALKRGMAGDPVSLPFRGRIEAHLQQSMGNVRCFSGHAARQACAAVGARAFVVADVMILAEPTPPFDVVLHEAIHLVQQAGHSIAAKPPEAIPMGSHGDESEQQAHAVAEGVTFDALTGGRTTPPSIDSTSPQLSGFFYLSGCSSDESNRTSVQPGRKGVSNADGNGWLEVRMAAGKIPMPWYLKVNHTGRVNNRDEFEVLEGRFQGQTGSVRAKGATESYLASGLSYNGGAAVTFRKGDEKLVFGGTEIEAFTQASNPLPTGKHEIQIPYEPHGKGAGYGAFATTWFRLGTSGDRFLHPGTISLGCATVRQTSAWPALYRYLINSRQSATAVGTLTVED